MISNSVWPSRQQPPGSPVPGILQARTLEWVAISFSNTWKWEVKVMPLSDVWLLATPWTAAYQAPLAMGFSRQEYWSGSPVPSLNLIHKRLYNHFYLFLFLPHSKENVLKWVECVNFQGIQNNYTGKLNVNSDLLVDNWTFYDSMILCF